MEIILRNNLKLGLVIIAIATMGALSTLVSSCSDDILDRQPLSDIADNNIFNDDALLEAYVNGTYRVFRFFQFGAFHTDGATDDAVNLDPDGNNFTRYNRAETSADNGEGFTREAWSHNYSYIRRVNLFFDKTMDSDVSPELLERLKAEMRFLRSWAYFDLISWYGDVPLITEVVALGAESFDRSRAPYDEVVGFIMKELDEAIPNLPIELFDDNTGKATRGVAMGLKSRVLLYAASPLHNPGNDPGKWQVASDAAEAVINLGEYEIDPEYSNLHNVERSHEIIYARGFTTENPTILDPWIVGLGWNMPIDRYYLPPNYFESVDTRFFTPLQSLIDAYESIDGSPVDPVNPYANRDPRFANTIIYHGSVIPIQGIDTQIEYHIDKQNPSNAEMAGPASFLNGGTASNYNVLKQTDTSIPLTLAGGITRNKPWIYMRKAEFYLNYAEAQIELGNDANAINAINMVRSRLSVNMPSFTETGEALRQRYRNERRIELVFENQRWYDIIRWEIGSEVLNDPARGVNITRDNTTDPPVDAYTYDRVIDEFRLWDPKMSYLPIPRVEIEASPSLMQNPGY